MRPIGVHRQMCGVCREVFWATPRGVYEHAAQHLDGFDPDQDTAESFVLWHRAAAQQLVRRMFAPAMWSVRPAPAVLR